MISYEEFYQSLKDAMLEPEMALEYGDKLRFLDKGYHPAGWMKDELNLVRSINTKRFNDTSDVLQGDFLIVKPTLEMQVRLSVLELYGQYCTGGMPAVRAAVRKALHFRVEGQEGLRDLYDYKKVRDRLYVRALNYGMNSAKMEGAVVRQAGVDIYLVLYMMISQTPGNVNWTKVPAKCVESWGMTEQEAIDRTLEDCSVRQPARLYLNFSDINSKDPEIGKFMDRDVRIGSMRSAALTTYASSLNGAVAIFYPGVMQRLAEIVGGSYFVSFTSIHEVMIHGKGFRNVQQVVNALRRTNRAFNTDDKLTDYVHWYDAEKKALGTVV